MALRNLYPAADEQIVLEDWDSFGEKAVHAREVRQILKNGTVIDARVTSHPLEFNGSKACLSMAEDITERKAFREALAENEKRLRLAVTGSGLYSVGIPKDSIVEYETAIRSDKFVVVVHGTADELARAKDVLGNIDHEIRLHPWI